MEQTSQGTRGARRDDAVEEEEEEETVVVGAGMTAISMEKPSCGWDVSLFNPTVM